MTEAAIDDALSGLGCPTDVAQRLRNVAERAVPEAMLATPSGRVLRVALAAASNTGDLVAFGDALLARAAPADELERGVAAHVRALIAWRRDDDPYDALAWIEVGRDHLRRAGDEGAFYEGRLDDTLGQVLLHQGRFAAARESFERALAVKRAAGDRAGIALTQGNLARMLMAVGGFRAAATHLAEDLAWLREQPDAPPRVLGQLATELAVCEMECGELDDASRRLDDVAAAARARDDAVGEAFALAQRGRLALRRETPGAALAFVAAAERRLESEGAGAWPELRGLLLHVVAVARAASGDSAGARAAFDAARARYAAAPRVTPVERAELFADAARCAEEGGALREAADLLREALHALDATGADAQRTMLDAWLKRLDPARWTLYASGRFMGHRELERILDQASRGGFRGHEEDVVVLFSDLRGFTSLSERLAPEALVATLNRHFEDATRAIEAFGGRVDKFIGDAVMAVFPVGCDPRGHGVAAARAAFAIQTELARWNRALQAEAGPLAATIGLHAGRVVAGLVGSPQRSSFTVLGDVVNTASRIEGMCRLLGAPLVVSDEFLATLPADGGWIAVPLGRFVPKGRDAAVGVHALIARDRPGAEAEAARRYAEDAARAFALRAAGDGAAARRAFERLATSGRPGAEAFVRWSRASASPTVPSSRDPAREDALPLEEK